ncbi:MAG: 30S ribosome-binding factor RbfA [Candidatus Omnitrophota bacterium]
MDRMNRINQQMKKEISDIILRDVKDPRLGFVTITEVQVSRDLQHARIFYSALGNAEKAKSAQSGLDSAKGFIRRLVGQRVRLRLTPELEFVFDQSIEYGARIEEALGEIKENTRQNPENE